MASSVNTPTILVKSFFAGDTGQARDRLNGLFQIVLIQVVGYIRNNCSLAQIFALDGLSAESPGPAVIH